MTADNDITETERALHTGNWRVQYLNYVRRTTEEPRWSSKTRLVLVTIVKKGWKAIWNTKQAGSCCLVGSFVIDDLSWSVMMFRISCASHQHAFLRILSMMKEKNHRNCGYALYNFCSNIFHWAGLKPQVAHMLSQLPTTRARESDFEGYIALTYDIANAPWSPKFWNQLKP